MTTLKDEPAAPGVIDLGKALRDSLKQPAAPTPDTCGVNTQARESGCLCHWEVGDSPCPVHGEDTIDALNAIEDVLSPGGGTREKK